MAFKGGFSLEQLRLDRLYGMYMGLTSREQTFALIGGGIGLLLLIVLPVMVATNSIRSLERNIDQQQREFKQIIREIDTYKAMQSEVKGLESSIGGGFDPALSTTMESIATKLGLRDRIDSLKERPGAPSDLFEQASVDVRLRQVPLKELITFLHDIENDPEKVLRIEKLEIKPRFDNKSLFDASFTVSTYRLQEQGTEGGG